MPPPVTLDHLRRFAVARTLFAPTTLPKALARFGFVQADPMRAPARAQDLTLRHRVKDYRAGDLERRYPRLAVEEDFFVNYGFVARELHALMHPRTPRTVWPKSQWDKAGAVLQFVRERGVVHPREVDAHFRHGKARNWFGGSGNASTQLLDGMHYRGLLRVARREGGVRLYAPRDALATNLPAHEAHDALADAVAAKYAPLPHASLGQLMSHLCGGVPQWRAERAAAFKRLTQRLVRMRLDGVDWYWPAGEDPRSARHRIDGQVRLLAPFDPIVWDRRRFELLWGWAYRFEAYTPPARRVRGHYALPLLWRDRVIGWGNLSVRDGALRAELGYVAGRSPRESAFRAALDDELGRIEVFLGRDAAAD